VPPVDISKTNVLTDYAERLRSLNASAPLDDFECANLLANGFWDCRLCGGYPLHHCLDFNVYPDGPYVEPLDLVGGSKLTDEQMQPIIMMTSNNISIRNVTSTAISSGGGSNAFVAVAGPVRYESTVSVSSGVTKEILSGLKAERAVICNFLSGGMDPDFTLGPEFFGELCYADALSIRQNCADSYAGTGRNVFHWEGSGY
jgi:hypothetical protein